eukprot:GILI01001679.1.p1 GENE.GILI01001679.1~~GILI01001679.1.p1  ORF type:complete len:315 (+),score=30.09 GILI01001679.1:128-946(+)
MKLPPLSMLLPPEILNSKMTSMPSPVSTPSCSPLPQQFMHSCSSSVSSSPSPKPQSVYPAFAGLNRMKEEDTSPIPQDPFTALLRAARAYSTDSASYDSGDSPSSASPSMTFPSSPETSSAQSPSESDQVSDGSYGSRSYQRATYDIVRPFSCKYPGCKKAFTQPSSLQRHMKVHTEDNLYACQHPGCGRNFTSQANLELHMRLHTADRPFVCKYESCGKRFSSMGILQGHLRTHTGERPYICNLCGKTFTQTGHLGRHKLCHLKKDMKPLH